MDLKRIWAVTFSPTGNTEKAAHLIANDIAETLQIPCKTDSFTLPENRQKNRCFSSDELMVFAVPTYAGRIPNKILPAVQTLFSGSDTPAIPLVTFGNRAFDESLKELRNELSKNGFIPIGAAAVVSCHVFTERLGTGRPDDNDKKQLHHFAESIAKLLKAAATVHDLPAPILPGNDEPVGPYYTPLDEKGDPARFLKAVPAVDTHICIHCGTCARVCPMGSVSPEYSDQMTGICIKCQACIQNCPAHARSFTDPAMLSHIRMLENHYARRAALSVFLS